MPSGPARIELTPRAIDFGNRVVLVSQITSFGVVERRPFLPLAVVLAIAAVLMAGYAISIGARPLAVNTGGSGFLWAACVAGALGLFGGIYTTRRLIIATSDGAKIAMPAGKDGSHAALMEHLRRILLADPKSNQRASIDPATGELIDDPVVETTAAAMRRMAEAQTEVIIADIAPSRHGAGSSHRPAASAAAGMTNGAYRDRVAEALASAEPVAGDIEKLTAFIEKRDVPHKDVLIGLLRVVDDHLQGGGTSQTEAAAHWKSFSDYVTQYLGTIEGLSPLTKDVGRRINLD